MNKEEIKLKLESISANSHYLRVSESHPLELYLGKNENGYPTLRYNGNFKHTKIIGNSILEIKRVSAPNYNSLLFIYNDEENLSLFYNFCEDIITQTENYEGDNGYIEIVNRYNKWKKLFYGSNHILTENEVMGLIGELLFLKDHSFIVFGQSVGLNGWSGPEPTHKDFSYKDEWYEIKSVNSFKNTVSISSIEQLDSTNEGFLVVYSFEKMSASFNGISLNDLVKSIISQLTLDNDKDIFIEKLKQAGYAYNDIYDNYIFNLISVNKYLIKDDFPRLRLEDIPKGILKAKYELSLSHIEKYKVE